MFCPVAGNRWVVAAKQLVSGLVGIDMLAGPSELLVMADHTACPATIAADLLAQVCVSVIWAFLSLMRSVSLLLYASVQPTIVRTE